MTADEPRLTTAELRRLHALAQAGRWNVGTVRFGAALERSLAADAGGGAAGTSTFARASRLHLEDLALACACTDGDEAAWDHFVREWRPVLYRAADALDPGGGAREVADSLYADLYGIAERDGARRPLFSYFHGRSSLSTWLRAVLSQRLVDRARASRRVESLDDDAPVTAPAAPDPLHRTHVAALVAALRTALASLTDDDRLKVGLYHGQQLTLAQIARLTGEHEATISRHLTRIRRTLRDGATAALRADGLSDAAIAECITAAADDPGALDVAELLSPDDTARLRAARVHSKEGTR